MNGDRATLLVVDDEAERQLATLAAQASEVYIEAVHPRDVSLDHLRAADVVLVDLRIGDWASELTRHISMQPLHGVALAGVLRAHAEMQRGTPTAFALRSAHLEDVSPAFPPDAREHSIARRLNLEWVFPKTDPLERAIIL